MTAAVEARQPPRLNRVALAVILVMSAGLIFAGLQMPALSITNFYFFSSHYSILDGIESLYRQGDRWLAVLVFAFTVVFPFFKIVLGLAALASAEAIPRLMRWLLDVTGSLSKWSMLDVFAIALVIVAVNGRVFSWSNVEAGVAFFAFGVFLSTLVIYRLKRYSARTLD